MVINIVFSIFIVTLGLKSRGKEAGHVLLSNIPRQRTSLHIVCMLLKKGHMKLLASRINTAVILPRGRNDGEWGEVR